MTASGDAGTLHGRRIADRYRLESVIGAGGAGTVWLAVDEVLARRVAVKEITAPYWLAADSRDALRDRTLREARAAARIGQHPNVVTVYDVVEEDDRPWIVMQHVEARPLADIIEQDGPCRPRRVAELGLQLLSALQAAHAQGILHRDVKPSNVLVTEDGQAVLTDFGIAHIDGDAALTASGVLMGAPSYIPPERAQGSAATAASDLWSLGATLYCAVEGRPPFQREGALATIAAAVNEQPDPTSRAGPLAPLLEQLLARDPAARPSAEEVYDALSRITASDADATSVGVLPVDTDADAPPVATEDGAPTSRRRGRAPALAAVAVLGLLAVVLASLLARQPTPQPGVPSPELLGEQTSSAPATPVDQVSPSTPEVRSTPAAVSRAPVATSPVQRSPSPVSTTAATPLQPPVAVTGTSTVEPSTTTTPAPSGSTTPPSTTDSTTESTAAVSSPAAIALP